MSQDLVGSPSVEKCLESFFGLSQPPTSLGASSGFIDEFAVGERTAEEVAVAHRFELFRSVDEDVHPDPWRERLIEAAAALGKSLSCVGDEDQVEIALAPDIAASERAEENRPPHAESRRRPHDSLELCLEPSPAALARSPVHYLSVLRPVPNRHHTGQPDGVLSPRLLIADFLPAWWRRPQEFTRGKSNPERIQ